MKHCCTVAPTIPAGHHDFKVVALRGDRRGMISQALARASPGWAARRSWQRCRLLASHRSRSRSWRSASRRAVADPWVSMNHGLRE